MNYIVELNAMRDYLLMTWMPKGQIALWHALMMVDNLSGWKTWFNAPNKILIQLAGMSKNGIIKSREALRKRGLIDYIPGASGTIPAQYRILPVSESVREGGYGSGGKRCPEGGPEGVPYIKEKKTKENKKNETTNPFLKMLEEEAEA